MEGKQDLLSLLRQVRSGSLTPEQAILKLKEAPYEDLGYAKVDFHRSLRQGAAEVIYGQSKTPEQIAGILTAMGQRGCKNVLVTRLSPESAQQVARAIPLDYHPQPRLAVAFPAPVESRGLVAVVSGGTRACTGCSATWMTSCPPGVSSPWPVWRGRWPRWWAAWWTAPSSPCPPAWAMGPASAACPPCCPCSTPAPAG